MASSTHPGWLVRARTATPTFSPWVFWPSALVIVAFVATVIAAPKWSADFFAMVQSNLIASFGWYYVLLVAVFIIFVLWVGLGRFGDIKLGRDEDKPEFTMVAWLSMLFSAGMGVGLVFWGVSEPLFHLAAPKPGTTGSDVELARAGLAQTYLHWGVHAWSIYVVVGLAMAYAIHRRGRPVSIRWALEPLLGKMVKGPVGNLIDVFSIVGALFGVATSLGFGVMQINGGLDFLGVLELSTMTQSILIAAITAITMFSLVSGVKRGMKWLSTLTMVMACGLLLFVLVSGPTLFILREFVESIGTYLGRALQMTFDVSAFEGEAGEKWQAGWTTFYWANWICWSPFVGIFIARISKGRTVREFVVGVLAVPTVFTFLWFSVMGGTALHRELFGSGGLIQDGTVDPNTALFSMLDSLPAGTVLVTGATILVALFFITSSDSGSFVLGMLASGGGAEPPLWSRFFWATATSAVAVALLWTGGLDALKTASVIMALPFSAVMVVMCLATWKAFRQEHYETERIKDELFREELVVHLRENEWIHGPGMPRHDDTGHAHFIPAGAAPALLAPSSPEPGARGHDGEPRG